LVERDDCGRPVQTRRTPCAVAGGRRRRWPASLSVNARPERPDAHSPTPSRPWLEWNLPTWAPATARERPVGMVLSARLVRAAALRLSVGVGKVPAPRACSRDCLRELPHDPSGLGSVGHRAVAPCRRRWHRSRTTGIAPPGLKCSHDCSSGGREYPRRTRSAGNVRSESSYLGAGVVSATRSGVHATAAKPAPS
jgi:hypothetical protein